MERYPERDSMDRRKPIEQVQRNNLETKNEGFGSADQRFFHDSSGNMNTNIGPPDYNLSVGARHMLNYSIQTGEEFVLAFMRERAIPRQHLLPNAYANCSTTSYLNQTNNLGNNLSGSESKTENPHVSRMGEISSLVLERKNPSANKNGNFSESLNTVPKSSSRTDVCKGLQSYTSSGVSDRSSTSMKFLCSFGGKILPRPSDGKLRFVGGETRLLEIKKEISWAALIQKALEVYNQARIIKYQLPGEGLDALVSVCCDEDLQNMMEECKVLEYGGAEKPRIFLFSNPSLEDAHISMGDTESDSEFQYLIAVNGMDLSAKRNSTGQASNSKNNRELVLCNERGNDPPIMETDKVNTTGLVPDMSSSTLQPSHPLLSSSPSAYDLNSQLYQEHDHKEANRHVFSQLVEIFPKLEESGNVQYLESEVRKCVPNMIEEADKIQSIRNQKILSSCPCDCSVSNNIPRKQGSDVNPSADGRSPLLPSTSKSIKHQEILQSSVPRGTINKGEKTIIPDHLHTSSGASTPKQNSSVKLAYRNFQAIDDELAQLETYKEISENIDKKNADVSQVTDVGTCVVDSADDQEVTKVGKNYEDHSIESSCTAIQSQLVADPHSSCRSVGETDSNQGQFPKVKITASDDNETKTKKQPPPLVFKDKLASGIQTVVSSVAVGSTGQGDIPIDITERFPLDFFSDMFSKARVSGDILDLSPLHVNGTGLDLNMQNHESTHSLYSRDLVQDEPVENNISLIDLDIKPLTNVQEKPSVDNSFPSLKAEGLQVGHPNSQFNVEEKNPQMSSSILGIGSNAIDLHSDYITAQLKVTDGAQVDEVNAGSLNLDCQDGKNTAGSLLNISLGDIKISFLQIIRNEDLEELRELESGTFGKVFHGKWRGTDVAIKRIKKNCFNGEMSEQERLTLEFWREAEILSKLHHPNVVAFYGAVQDGPGGTLAIVTEYMANGSLRHVLLCNDRHLDCLKRLIIAMDAAFGMEYLHSKNIVHFDLKCDNLLVDLRDPAQPICKVTDFGMSKIKRETMVTANIRGTLPWMAPELLNGSSSKVSEKVDVFSFGIVLWEILTGEEPYANLHYAEIIGGIVSNTLRPPVPTFCDPEWKKLMEQCWDPNPVARPSFTEIARRLRAMSTACQSKPPGHPEKNQVHK